MRHRTCNPGTKAVFENGKWKRSNRKKQFRKELSEERAKQLKLTENLVAEEREKAKAQQEKKDAERRMNEEREAMKQALEFTSRVLKDVSCPELEGKIRGIGHKAALLDRTRESPVRLQRSHGITARPCECDLPIP